MSVAKTPVVQPDKRRSMQNTKELQEPADPEKLTLKQVRDSIPAHFFKQNTAMSIYYLGRDLCQVAVTAWLMHQLVLPAVAGLEASAGAVVGTVAWLAAWQAYWYFQGLNFTAIWVLAHECGHRAFSPSTAINDAFGWVLHSALLVPYHSWRISHGNHHKNTNHLDLDTVFVPEKVDARQEALKEAFKESPVASVGWIVAMLTIGWPGYLLLNATGQRYSRRANHFEPQSPLFRPSQAMDVVSSVVGIALALAVVGFFVAEYGATAVAAWYGMPYLWTNAWLVFITYLQHSDIRVPHYAAEHWNFLRGALSTVDRDFGPMLNWWLHHINDSHVVHHLFSSMPFYNAIQVTRKHMDVLGAYYMKDARPLRTSLWESWRNCRYIVPQDGVAYFKK